MMTDYLYGIPGLNVASGFIDETVAPMWVNYHEKRICTLDYLKHEIVWWLKFFPKMTERQAAQSVADNLYKMVVDHSHEPRQ